MTSGWTTPGVLAQNSPPKAESDCAITNTCSVPTAPPAHHGMPLWGVELVMFAVVAVLVLFAYRMLTSASSRAGSTSGRSA